VAGVVSAPALDRAACRAEVESRFSTARMVEEHLALYERLLEEHAPSAPRAPARVG
jgi:hypothetical protein